MMIKKVFTLLVFLSLSCSICEDSIDEEATTKKILFIGSSYFVYNNLPSIVEQLAVEGNKDVQIHSRMSIRRWNLELSTIPHLLVSFLKRVV